MNTYTFPYGSKYLPRTYLGHDRGLKYPRRKGVDPQALFLVTPSTIVGEATAATAACAAQECSQGPLQRP